MTTPQIPVAKEGVPFIALAAFTTLIVALLEYDIASGFLLFVTFFITWFFRDPERIGPDDDNYLVSPADGKVILVEQSDSHDLLDGETYKISIFMNIFNVHVNRTPFGGKIDKISYIPGKFYSADSAKGDLKNERCAISMTTERNQQIVFVQVAGLIARRIVCWIEKGDTIKRGSRFGLIRFGSRVDLYIPSSTKLDINVGDQVRAGETILGCFE